MVGGAWVGAVEKDEAFEEFAKERAARSGYQARL